MERDKSDKNTVLITEAKNRVEKFSKWRGNLVNFQLNGSKKNGKVTDVMEVGDRSS